MYNLLIAVDLTFLRCSTSLSTSTSHIQIGNILTLALNTQQYAKTKPKLDSFDKLFLEFEAVSDCKNSTRQLLSTSSYLAILYLKFFWVMTNCPRSPFFHV